MARYNILYNSLAANGNGEENAKKLRDILKGDELRFEDVTKVDDYKAYFEEFTSEDIFVLCGGDGTLNRFVNNTKDIDVPEHIYYYPAGTGNDFANDINYKEADGIVEISNYLKDLPTVIINGKEELFLDGIGYGIDGYCCEEGDRLKATSDKPVNYTAIAIKGLLFKFKPANATVSVDGKEMKFKKVWLAPTMNGRFYGGGMMPTPSQDRASKDRHLSLLVWHGSGKLSTLSVFPSIFKGEHLKHDKMCKLFTGKEITVSFDKPCALQIDGETVKDVTSYTARL